VAVVLAVAGMLVVTVVAQEEEEGANSFLHEPSKSSFVINAIDKPDEYNILSVYDQYEQQQDPYVAITWLYGERNLRVVIAKEAEIIWHQEGKIYKLVPAYEPLLSKTIFVLEEVAGGEDWG
jgi:hypothetical protein